MRTHYAKRFSWPNQSARALQMLGCKLGVLETGVLVWAGLHRDSIRSVSFYRAAWNADAVWMMRKLFLCPSVCQTHALWQNGRKICPDFYTIRKIFNLVFWEEEWLVRGEPFYLKFWVNEGRSQDFTLGHRSWAPKARESRRREGWRLGRGVPLPNRLGGLGSVVSSSSGVRGGEPAANAFGICEVHRTLLVERTVPTKPFFSVKIHSIDDWGAWPLPPLWIRPWGQLAPVWAKSPILSRYSLVAPQP